MPRLPLRGFTPVVVMPGIAQTAYPYYPPKAEKRDIDVYSDERFVHPDNLKAFRKLKELKEYFWAKRPEFRYTKCLGWGGNGLAAAFDIIDVYGLKQKSVVVKMLFRNSDSLLELETKNCEPISFKVFPKFT
jgi:hypothetical protein